MKIRSLPFGYCIRDGKICVDERDSSTVRMIFEGYIQNASYQKVADMLERQGTPYIPEKRWNKNIVARILKNRRYIGDEEYPSIITETVFQCAEAANTWSCNSPEHTRLMKNMRALVRCPICGGVMPRNFRANWRCPDCMDTSVKVTDEALERSAAELLKQSDRTASHMDIPDASSEMGTIQGLEDELLQVLDEAEFDETAAKDRAMALASARFDVLGSEDYEIMRLKYILSNKEQDGEFDAGLFFDIASAILIYPSGAISLKLKMEKLLKRSALNDRNGPKSDRHPRKAEAVPSPGGPATAPCGRLLPGIHRQRGAEHQHPEDGQRDAHHYDGGLCSGGEQVVVRQCPVGHTPSYAGRQGPHPVQMSVRL